MIKVSAFSRKYCYVKANRALEALQSDRKIEEAISRLERSTSERERLQSICMRAILGGNTEEAFQKACKVYTKTTKERLRIV